MKMPSTASIVIALCSIGLGVAILFPSFMHSAKQEPSPTWSKWSDPKITSDMWEGTSLWQFRTNLNNGEIEGMCKRLSEHGGYK